MPDAAGPGTPDAMECPGEVLGFDPTNFDKCLIEPLAGTYMMGPGATPQNNTWTLRTDTGILTDGNGDTVDISSKVLSQASGPDVLVVSVASLHLQSNTNLRINGNRPLILVASGDITIDGLLAAGALGTTSGPGGGSNCTTGTGTNGMAQIDSTGANTGGSGGGGGGFGSSGGDGAAIGDIAVAVTAPGGLMTGNQTIQPLRGGCRGGNGGGNNGGMGGGAGGAIQLVSGGTIQVNASGNIAVRGGGGARAAMAGGGGGGGGSGGAIFLEAKNIMIAGPLTANGGGGGEGAEGDTAGTAGLDGSINMDTAAPGGNTANNDGGNGGNGGAGSNDGADGEAGADGSDTSTAHGGGGGGGGVGRIRLRRIDMLDTGGAIISPGAYTGQ